MARSERFESLLQSLCAAWLELCAASAARAQTAPAAVSRVVFRPPAGVVLPADATLELALADLGRHQWMRPARMALSFDCELRQRADRSWRLRIVAPGRWRWPAARPRHRVDIVYDGATGGVAQLHFDGEFWRESGSRSDRRAP